MKIYRIEKWDLLKVKEFELVKETEKSVVVKESYNTTDITRENRYLKSSDYYSFFKTEEEAIQALIERSKRKLKYAESEVERYTDSLKELLN